VVGELLGALAEFLVQTVNPFAKWAKRGEDRREGEERQEQEQPRGQLSISTNHLEGRRSLKSA
jgi:hypothetical protein